MNILEFDPTHFVAQTFQDEPREKELTDEDLQKIYRSTPEEWIIEALYTLYKRYTSSQAASSHKDEKRSYKANRMSSSTYLMGKE